VQGSWPEYLAAYNARFSDDIARKIVAAEAAEETTFVANPKAGLALMRERLAQNPGYYLYWYIVQKPFLLWDWSVRVGWGDIYFLATEKSPYERLSVLRLIKNSFALLNPVFFALAALCAFALVVARWRGATTEFGLTLVARLAVYVTALHVVFQAEPRYAIPYRAEEVLLAVTAGAWGVGKLRRRLPDGGASALPHTPDRLRA